MFLDILSIIHIYVISSWPLIKFLAECAFFENRPRPFARLLNDVDRTYPIKGLGEVTSCINIEIRSKMAPGHKWEEIKGENV
jgi:hypothetical protein